MAGKDRRANRFSAVLLGVVFAGLPTVAIEAAAQSAGRGPLCGVASWTAIGPPSVNVTAVAFTHGSRPIAYIATAGEILRSADRGDHWIRVASPTGYVRMLVADPSNEDVVYAVSSEEILKTADGGETWSPIAVSLARVVQFDAFAVDPTDASTLFVGGQKGRLYKSEDGGASWFKSDFGLPAKASVISISVDPFERYTVFAGTAIDGLFVSHDGGTSWVESNPGEEGPTSDLLFDPTQTGIVYRGLSYGEAQVQRSSDHGSHWLASGDGLPPGLGVVEQLILDPHEPAVVYAGFRSGGVARSTDAGTTWTIRNWGLWPKGVADLALDPTQPGTLLAATGAGLFRSTSGADFWSRVIEGRPGDYPVRSIAADPRFSGTLYVGGNGVVFKTADNGGTWSESADGLPNNVPVERMAVDPRDPALLYAVLGGVDGRLFKSTDAGASWFEVREGFPPKVGINALAIDPTDSNVIFAGTAEVDAPILKSVDGGMTWTVRGQEMSAPISGLAIDPRNPDIAYATSYKELGLFTTHDGGEHWRLWLGRGYPLPLFFEARFTSVLLDSQREGVIHIGTVEHGVVTSLDGGRTWKVPVAGFPAGTAVDGLALDATVSRLYVVTYGGLIYSEDDGATWAPIRPANGAPDSRGPIAIDAAGSTVYATGTGPGRKLLSAEIGSASCTTPSPAETPEPSPTDTPAPTCAGDCDRSGSVTVEELVRSGSIALGETSLAECAPLDLDQSGAVTVDEIVSAVAHALTGC